MSKFSTVIEGILKTNGHPRYEEDLETKDGGSIKLVAMNATSPTDHKPNIDIFGLVVDEDGNKHSVHSRNLMEYIKTGQYLGFKVRAGEKLGYKNYGQSNPSKNPIIQVNYSSIGGTNEGTIGSKDLKGLSNQEVLDKAVASAPFSADLFNLIYKDESHTTHKAENGKRILGYG
jgi:hypothetical protein